ncbi:MAG: Tol-Pal system beta propeller repeat protein TolB [Gammaproteobacteria bacterium]|nr:Tol-Pal system beta propeller repeat protein TolB [Gammaproteobacteria bacterium]
MFKVLRIFGVCFLVLFSKLAFATLEIELTQGIDSATPIAIANFEGEESISAPENKISAVLQNDLKNSGQFRILDNKQTDFAANVDYALWQGQKIDYVTVGKVVKNGDQYNVSFRLFDIYHKNQALDKNYTVKASQLRTLAHHISDLIYQQVTGDRGVFSTKIAYIIVERKPNQKPKYRLEVADADGFNPKTLLNSSFPLMSPAWSSDGRKIAYVSFEGNRAQIFVQDVFSGDRKIISKYPGINGAPAWSPDGKKLALVLTLTGYPKIYTLDLGSNTLTRITDDWFLDTEPAWSPDGASLIFTSNRGGNPQIYRVTLADKKVTRLTYSGSYNARGSFVKNGKSIAMLHQDGDMFNIAAQDLATGRVTVLSNSGFDESPSIAPNGKMVVYATHSADRGVLAEVSMDGRVKLLLPAQDGEVQEPAWSPFFN